MATITPSTLQCPGEPHSGKKSYLKLTITEITQTDGGTNQTTVKWKITMHNAWSTMYRAYCTLGGKVLYDAKPEKESWSNGATLASGTTTFDNNNDGSLVLNAYLKQLFYYGNGVASRWTNPSFYQDASTTMTCSTIPRYFSSTPTLTLKGKTETSMTYSWSTTEECSSITVAGTGTKSVTGVPGKSGEITITGLSPGTSFGHTATFTRSDSKLTTNSSATNTTYNYPYLTGVESKNLLIGNSQKLTLYNPLNRTVTIKMRKDSSTGTELYSGSTNTTSITFTPVADTLYASIPNNQSAKAVYQCIYGNLHTNSTSNDFGYQIKGSENPVFDSTYLRDVIDTLHANDITGKSTKIIKGHNKITGTVVRMGARASSTGKRYVINANASPASQEITHDSSTNKTFTFSNLNDKSFNVIAYDSRGLSTNATVSVDLINYSKPKVNNFTIIRQNGLSNYAILSADGSFTHWSGWSEIKKYNSIQKVYFRYKVSGGNNWSSWSDITSALTKNTNGSWVLSKTLDINFNTTTKYDFQLYVNDVLESSNIYANTLSTANGFLWRDLAKKWLGINKKPTCALDVNGDLNVDGVITSRNKLQVQSEVVANKVEATEEVVANQVQATKLITTEEEVTTLKVSDSLYLNGTEIKNLMAKYLPLAGGTVSGNLVVNGHVQVDGNLITGKWLGTDPTNLFQTTIFGSNATASRFKVIRSSFTGVTHFPKDCTGIAFNSGDTHGFILPHYSANYKKAYIGAGNADKLNWVEEIGWKQSELMGIYSGTTTIKSTAHVKLGLTESVKSGEELSISDGGIRIGAGVTKVEVSANVYFSTGIQSGDSIRCFIYKNDTSIAHNFNRCGGTYEDRNISSFMVNVTEGDILYLYGGNATNGRGVITDGSYLKVRVIK